MNEENTQGLIIQIPFPENFAALVQELNTAAAAIKTDLEEIKGLKEAKISYSEPEAAELLGLSPHTLLRFRREGKINFSRIGSKPRYLPEHIKDFIKSREIK